MRTAKEKVKRYRHYQILFANNGIALVRNCTCYKAQLKKLKKQFPETKFIVKQIDTEEHWERRWRNYNTVKVISIVHEDK